MLERLVDVQEGNRARTFSRLLFVPWVRDLVFHQGRPTEQRGRPQRDLGLSIRRGVRPSNLAWLDDVLTSEERVERALVVSVDAQCDEMELIELVVDRAREYDLDVVPSVLETAQSNDECTVESIQLLETLR